ncbi:MAG: lysostaphin resistance A-like protein [Acidimicrobiales bacterium]
MEDSSTGRDGDRPVHDAQPGALRGYPPPGYLATPRPQAPYPPPGGERSGSQAHGAGGGEAPPSTPSQGWTWVAFAVVGFLVGQVVSAVLLYVAAAVSGHLSDIASLSARAVPPAWVVVVELVGLWIGFGGAVVAASRTRGSRSIVRDMRIGLRPSDLVVGPVVGLGAQLLLLPLLYLPLEPLIPHLSKRLSQPAKHLTGGFPGTDLAVVAVLTVLVVPVVEETFFRGLLLNGFLAAFGRTGRVIGPVLSCCVTGIAFGLAHFEPLQLLGLAAFGIVLSVMAYRLKRLGPCMLAHAAFNLVAILVVAFPTGLLR